MYCNPPNTLHRNSLGLIDDDSVTYVYNEDGRIDWRRMVNPKYVIPNKELTDEKDISKLDDSKLVIKLGGFRELAQVRGYFSVNYRPIVATSEYVATVCAINWMPNYETNGNVTVFEALADASVNSTRGIAMNHLAAIAENRAFSRCVRNFLNICVVGEEEASASDNVPSAAAGDAPTPVSILGSLVLKKGLTFDDVKAILIEEKFDKADSFQNLSDIPQLKVYDLIERLQKFKKC